MVCPWKKVVSIDAGVFGGRIVRTTFGECDKKECPFYSGIDTRNTSGYSVHIENCLRVMGEKEGY